MVKVRVTSGCGVDGGGGHERRRRCRRGRPRADAASSAGAAMSGRGVIGRGGNEWTRALARCYKRRVDSSAFGEERARNRVGGEVSPWDVMANYLPRQGQRWLGCTRGEEDGPDPTAAAARSVVAASICHRHRSICTGERGGAAREGSTGERGPGRGEAALSGKGEPEREEAWEEIGRGDMVMRGGVDVYICL
uniref:Uncharacterized protein n=1 Tax=Oryza sativa subsp. japonica TaxID=39947 RepID=Q6H6A2_ORYSJ|nr:hypothetical protein [Oryza sativa Japonica Group]BAD25747.1 hypothetical protein [Oryza sativa Japonica Group]